MSAIIDFHAHAFPDKVAATAVPALAAKGKVTPCLDGTIASLLASMAGSGVDKSVLCSIATRPGQFDSILAWSKEIRSERIIPFPSFHPENPKALENIRLEMQESMGGAEYTNEQVLAVLYEQYKETTA
ncbi:MAG: amidohydrolase, partial [Desulfurivibrionaceae bacterium]|nr:amidohydrolase [Desulfurivibrionaceae bacterium]